MYPEAVFKLIPPEMQTFKNIRKLAQSFWLSDMYFLRNNLLYGIRQEKEEMFSFGNHILSQAMSSIA